MTRSSGQAPEAYSSRRATATTTTPAMTTTNVNGAPGIFISRRAAATTTTTTLGNNERQVSDGEASCAREHTLIASCDGDKDNEVKRTCYASNIDAPTSQATSNIDGHELNRQT